MLQVKMQVAGFQVVVSGGELNRFVPRLRLLPDGRHLHNGKHGNECRHHRPEPAWTCDCTGARVAERRHPGRSTILVLTYGEGNRRYGKTKREATGSLDISQSF